MAVISDNFDRADGGLGVNWTTVDGNLQISGNQVVANSGTNDSSRYTAASFGTNHASRVSRTSGPAANSTAGVIVRAGADGCYAFLVKNASSETYKLWRYTVSGDQYVALAALNGTAPALPASIELRAVGSKLLGYVNDALVISHDLASDPFAANDQVGVFANNSSTVDDWSGWALEPPILLGSDQEVFRDEFAS